MSASTGQAVSVLPEGAAVPGFSMDLRDGRDQVARAVAEGGWESFEPPLPRLLFRTVRAWPGLFVDVGANTGFYTLLALAAHRRNRAVACEPVPAILEALTANLRENGMLDRARALACAIGDGNRDAPLFLPDPSHGLIETSASLRPDFKADHAGSMTVRQRRLDRVLLRPPWLARRISAIKIDVEGHEAAVLAGAPWVVRLHRPVIFIEILERADTVALDRFLRAQGYADIVLPAGGRPFRAERAGFHPDGWNHAFVPLPRLDAFLRLIGEEGGPADRA